MRLLSILLAVFILAPATAKEVKMVEYDWKVTKVVDGDTVKFEAPWVPDPIKKEMSIRVYGVDTPEKGFRGQCDKEKAAGEAATNFTKAMVKKGKSIKIAIWNSMNNRRSSNISATC